MTTRTKDFLKICAVLSCTFAVIWFGMLAAANQAHGAETRTERQKLLELLPSNLVIRFDLVFQKDTQKSRRGFWRPLNIPESGTHDFFNIEVGATTQMQILSDGGVLKIISFSDKDSNLLAYISFNENGGLNTNGTEFTEEDLVKYTALAQEILFAGLSEIVPNEVLKKLIDEKGYKPL